MRNQDRIIYTIMHRKAFKLCVEKLLKERDKKELRLRARIHDMDKVIYYLTMEGEEASELHRRTIKHHCTDGSKELTRVDYLEMIIDWECARYTKEDKLLNAYDTLKKYYPELEKNILPLLKELKLDYSNGDGKKDKSIVIALQKEIVNTEDIQREVEAYRDFLKRKAVDKVKAEANKI